MNKSIFGWIAVAALIWAWECPGEAVSRPAVEPKGSRFIIGLSPYLDQEVKDDVYRQIIRFLLEDLKLNSSLWIYDAYDLKTIAQVDVPDVRAFKSAKTRANQFREPILKLKEFLGRESKRPGGGSLKPQAIRFPQFMDFVADNLVRNTGSVVVALLGNPLYIDPKEPGFSMIDGYFPSDGHLLAGREESVFGVKGRSDRLRDVAVHFGYFGDPWVTEIHQEKIRRFWSLYLQAQGARLDTFCGDMATVFNSMRSRLGPEMEGNTGGPAWYAPDASDGKIEMLRITRDIGMADWITREVLPNVPSGPPSRTVGPMKIGIRWKGNLDLDLYATPYREAETLFFEHTRTPEGYYFKDHRSSPEREYEFIEFETPIDVWQVEALINFYKGHAEGGASGEVRIEFDGKIYAGQFSIASAKGNKGRSGQSESAFWTRIDVPAILKLRGGSAESRLGRR